MLAGITLSISHFTSTKSSSINNRLIAIILNFDLFKLLQKTDKINNVTKPRKASVRDKIQQKITKLAANIIDSHNKNVIKITL